MPIPVRIAATNNAVVAWVGGRVSVFAGFIKAGSDVTPENLAPGRQFDGQRQAQEPPVSAMW